MPACRGKGKGKGKDKGLARNALKGEKDLKVKVKLKVGGKRKSGRGHQGPSLIDKRSVNVDTDIIFFFRLSQIV